MHGNEIAATEREPQEAHEAVHHRAPAVSVLARKDARYASTRAGSTLEDRSIPHTACRDRPIRAASATMVTPALTRSTLRSVPVIAMAGLCARS